MTKKLRERSRRFLRAFEEAGTVYGAAKLARMDRAAHYRWMASDAQYREEFAEAEKIVCERLDQAVLDRALNGVLEPLVYQGEIVCKLDENGDRSKDPVTIRRYNDTMLIFAAKGRMPEKYRDNFKLDVAANVVAEVRDPELSKLNLEQLRALKAIAEQANGITNGHVNGGRVPAGLSQPGADRPGN